MRVRRLLALCLAALCVGPAATAHAALTIGLSDQQPATFSDPTFYDTGIATVRYITPWNMLTTDAPKLDAWMQAARRSNADVMIAFNRAIGSRCPSSPCTLPTVTDYTNAVRAFMAKYPWVRTYTPWNEVNDPGQPTTGNAPRVAQYYRALVGLCPTCTVLAADVIDNGTQTSWLRSFLSAVGTPVPQLWGLHNYVDGNYFRSTGTQSVLDLVPGEVWLTETGGLVQYLSTSGVATFPYDEQRAADAEQFLLSIADAHPDRITRYYHYLWRSGGKTDRFDTGLESADGTLRPAFSILRPRMPGRPKPAPAAAAKTPSSSTPTSTTTPADDPTGVDTATTPKAQTAAAKARRSVVVTRTRSRRPLRLRIACLASPGARCRGAVRVARFKVRRFSIAAGKAERLVLTGATVAAKPRVRVTLTAPVKGSFSVVPRVAIPAGQRG